MNAFDNWATLSDEDSRYPLIIAINDGSILIRNETGTLPVYSAENWSSIAFNAEQNRILWIERSPRNFTLHEWSISGNQSARREHLSPDISAGETNFNCMNLLHEVVLYMNLICINLIQTPLQDHFHWNTIGLEITSIFKAVQEGFGCAPQRPQHAK